MPARRQAALASLVLALLLAAGCFSLLALSGCACRSTYFRSCGRMTWAQMCRKNAACRTCLRESHEHGEDAARACWGLVNGHQQPAQP